MSLLKKVKGSKYTNPNNYLKLNQEKKISLMFFLRHKIVTLTHPKFGVISPKSDVAVS